MARLLAPYATLISESTVVTDAETLIGHEILCGHYDVLSLFIEYDKGNETDISILGYSMAVSGGDGFQLQTWSAAAGVKTRALDSFVLSADGFYRIDFDVTATEFIKFTMNANGGTPTGTIELAGYTMSGA